MRHYVLYIEVHLHTSRSTKTVLAVHGLLRDPLNNGFVQGSGYRIVHLLPIAILAFLLGYLL